MKAEKKVKFIPDSEDEENERQKEKDSKDGKDAKDKKEKTEASDAEKDETKSQNDENNQGTELNVEDENTPLGEAESSEINKMLAGFKSFKMKDLKFKGAKKLLDLYNKLQKTMKGTRRRTKTLKLYKELQLNRKKYVKKNVNIKRIHPVYSKAKNKKALVKLVKKFQNYSITKYKTKAFLKAFRSFRAGIKALNKKKISKKQLKLVTRDLKKAKKSLNRAKIKMVKTVKIK